MINLTIKFNANAQLKINLAGVLWKNWKLKKFFIIFHVYDAMKPNVHTFLNHFLGLFE